MASLVVLYDSCVLYPAPLRDLLMYLAMTDVYHAKWTNEIHEEWISKLTLPDLNDRHVLAAAIYAEASVIVTYNLKDFPEKILGRYDIEVLHPDEFLVNVLDVALEKICNAIKSHRLSLKNPSKTVEQYLETLNRQLLTKAVKKLEEYYEYI